MTPEALYARTDKGIGELAMRSQAIPARARSILVMIDGKATGAQLLAKFAAFPNSQELLELLETGEYIEALAASVPPQPAAADMALVALDATRRYMVQTLHDVLGPDADMLTGEVDRAPTPEKLFALAEQHHDLMAAIGQRRRAEDFLSQVMQQLSFA